MMSHPKLAIVALACLFAASALSQNHKITSTDTDYTIAHEYHISVAELHRDNPRVDWNRLHPGDWVDIPGNGRKSERASHHSDHKHEEHESSSHLHIYKPTNHDNDYTIAKKFGISLAKLHALNPNVDWDSIGPSSRVRVSEGGSDSSETHVIRTLHAVVDGNNVNLRAKPSTRSRTVTTLDAGVVARVIRRNGDWYQLKFPKGTVAWIRGDFLTAARNLHPGQEHRYTASRREYRHNRESRRSYIAEGPSRHTYHAGDFVHAPSEKDSKLIATAFRYRGTPYVWGGTSRSGGFDCSGFVGHVYSKNGIHLPRTSREQSHVGEEVSRNHLKKGDLVFFKTDGSGHVSHVGMYIGAGKFIQASSGSGRVMVSSLSDPYYYNRFAGARRIVHSKATSHKKKHSKK